MENGTVKPKLGPAKTLAERKAMILDMNAKPDTTLQDIADVFGLTRERVRQILASAGIRRNVDKWVAEAFATR
jgi:DNA-directed RNA polymerase specialized sigma subunit